MEGREMLPRREGDRQDRSEIVAAVLCGLILISLIFWKSWLLPLLHLIAG